MGAVELALLLGACALGAYTLTASSSRVVRAAVAPSSPRSASPIARPWEVASGDDSGSPRVATETISDQEPPPERFALVRDDLRAEIRGSLLDTAGLAVPPAQV